MAMFMNQLPSRTSRPRIFASREVLLAKKRELVEQRAKGNRLQACIELTIPEEDQLFELGLLGKHDQFSRGRFGGFFPFILAFERVANQED